MFEVSIYQEMSNDGEFRAMIVLIYALFKTENVRGI